jgi:hypothetical protein
MAVLRLRLGSEFELLHAMRFGTLALPPKTEGTFVEDSRKTGMKGQ